MADSYLIGPPGPRGETGPAGSQGEKGDSITGPQGPPGPEGTYTDGAIKAMYEANLDTNAFTDFHHEQLSITIPDCLDSLSSQLNNFSIGMLSMTCIIGLDNRFNDVEGDIQNICNNLLPNSSQLVPVESSNGKVLSINNGTPEWIDTTSLPGASTVSNADWNETNSSSTAFIHNKPSLSNVAFTGSYNSLSGRPNLSTVATTGNWDDIIGAPASFDSFFDENSMANRDILVWNSDDSCFDAEAFRNLPSPVEGNVLFSESGSSWTTKHIHELEFEKADWNISDELAQGYIRNKPEIHTVGVTGNYNDLENKPDIASMVANASIDKLSDVNDVDSAEPENESILVWDPNNLKWEYRAYSASDVTYHDVAITGSYNDLEDKPAIKPMTSLDEVTNVDTTGKTNGQLLKWDGIAGKWVAGEIGDSIQGDWEEADEDSVNFIKNKPEIVPYGMHDLSEGNLLTYCADTGLFVPKAPEFQDECIMQSDWTEEDVNSKAFIKNKPELIECYFQNEYEVSFYSDICSPTVSIEDEFGNMIMANVNVDRNNSMIVVNFSSETSGLIHVKAN